MCYWKGDMTPRAPPRLAGTVCVRCAPMVVGVFKRVQRLLGSSARMLSSIFEPAANFKRGLYRDIDVPKTKRHGLVRTDLLKDLGSGFMRADIGSAVEPNRRAVIDKKRGRTPGRPLPFSETPLPNYHNK